ncbi:MAG: HPF/RaiA family ribosome-associated protein [Candidatus Kapabacteria bacterium]|jgi:ribosomal subunit interface protein|nr:HPF/RaiA family ribosome-associated protein [Candidatus Kapabacteria bacterium]
MKTQVTFRHTKGHHPKLHEDALAHAEAFVKFHDGIISTNVEFLNETDKTVIITTHLQGATLVGKDGSDDFHKSLNSAADKVVRQIKKLKTKQISVRTKGVEV